GLLHGLPAADGRRGAAGAVAHRRGRADAVEPPQRQGRRRERDRRHGRRDRERRRGRARAGAGDHRDPDHAGTDPRADRGGGTMSWSQLPQRRGERPRTSTSNPQTQLDQNPPREIWDALAAKLFSLPRVEERPSIISVPGARALWLKDDEPVGDPRAFIA